MAGYEITLDHRYGGHDGPTEWEITTRIPVVAERVKKLHELEHPLLCAFHFYLEQGGSDGFCIREGAPPAFVAQVIFYLTALLPDEETFPGLEIG